MLEYWRSSIGKKQIVAITGAILVTYLLLHMLGNLGAIFGPGSAGHEARIDWYAAWLRDMGEPLFPWSFLLWVVRIGLFIALVIHVTGIVQLTRRNRAARPAGHPAARIGRSWEAGFMLVSGLVILAFLIFHILQFTTLTIDVTPLEEGAVYANAYFAFQKWYFVAIYITAVLIVGIHLRHGIWSLLQTLGLDNPGRNPRNRATGLALSLIIVVGFVLIPTLFATGALPAPHSPAGLIPGGAG
ncbi:MAG: succinate dehydrogenase cytochrome b subunit [Solirubrobacterales bacterium]|nr:succinate dehydrogenase cytochrome b subunit [Solirubrobacterales bacterium]